MYLYHEVICLYRCFCSNRCICAGLIFAVADALLAAVVSATCFSLSLKILLSSPIMYNCIYILSVLIFEDASFTNFASSTCFFYNLQITLAEILHLQFPKIHYLRYLPQHLLTSIYFTT